MTQAQQILEKAKSFIGVKESPANSNNVQFNTTYYGHTVSGASFPWCCVFIWCVYFLCGLSNLFYDGKKTASCEALLQWCIKKGYITTEPQPGDWVFFQFDADAAADHIGIFDCWNPDGTFYSIEGNTAVENDANGGEVMRRLRKTSQVKKFAHPPYTDSAVIVPTVANVGTYTKEQFIFDVCTIIGVTTAKEALAKTITISASVNKNHALVTPLERYMKAYNLYSGTIEADSKKTPAFGAKMTAAVKNYETGYLKTVGTGNISAKGKLWANMLGV